MNRLDCKILGVGTWGPGFKNFPQLIELLNNPGNQPEITADNPKPTIIPANERRRAPLSVRLAVESSWQATQAANVDPKQLASVFVSGLGDTQLTDYMCRTLADNQKHLSPTKFHNSVHNAAAGYWTISTGCTKTASSLAGLSESVPLALLEAINQCCTEQRMVLITFYDAPCSTVLSELFPCEHGFSASLVIAPASASKPSAPNMSIQVNAKPADWPKILLSPQLQRCYEYNPAARTLTLLQALSEYDDSNSSKIVTMPLSIDNSITLTIE